MFTAYLRRCTRTAPIFRDCEELARYPRWCDGAARRGHSGHGGARVKGRSRPWTCRAAPYASVAVDHSLSSIRVNFT